MATENDSAYNDVGRQNERIFEKLPVSLFINQLIDRDKLSGRHRRPVSVYLVDKLLAACWVGRSALSMQMRQLLVPGSIE